MMVPDKISFAGRSDEEAGISLQRLNEGRAFSLTVPPHMTADQVGCVLLLTYPEARAIASALSQMTGGKA